MIVTDCASSPTLLSTSTHLKSTDLGRVYRQCRGQVLAFAADEGRLRCWCEDKEIACDGIRGIPKEGWSPQALKRVLDAHQIIPKMSIASASAISSITLSVRGLGGMQIFIQTHKGKQITIDVLTEDTISQIKEKIRDKEKYDTNRAIALFFQGHLLDDNKKLRECGAEKEMTLDEVDPKDLSLEKRNIENLFIKFQVDDGHGNHKIYEFSCNLSGALAGYDVLQKRRLPEIWDVKGSIMRKAVAETRFAFPKQIFEKTVRGIYFKQECITEDFKLKDLATSVNQPLTFIHRPDRPKRSATFTWVLRVTVLLFIILILRKIIWFFYLKHPSLRSKYSLGGEFSMLKKWIEPIRKLIYPSTTR